MGGASRKKRERGATAPPRNAAAPRRQIAALLRRIGAKPLALVELVENFPAGTDGVVVAEFEETVDDNPYTHSIDVRWTLRRLGRPVWHYAAHIERELLGRLPGCYIDELRKDAVQELVRGATGGAQTGQED